jgi:hypothetical protein
MGVGEDDGYERKEFWSDCSCSIFYPSVKHLMGGLFEVWSKGEDLYILSTNIELY